MDTLAALIVFALIGMGALYVFRALLALWLFAAIGLGLLTLIMLAAQ